MPEINEETRNYIAEFLPSAIARALESYRQFLKDGPSDVKEGSLEDPAKNFKAHHDACKVAIAHVELLIKLGKAVEANAEELEEAERAQLTEAVSKAEKEILDKTVTKNP